MDLLAFQTLCDPTSLQEAAKDLRYLLHRGYAPTASLALVGDRRQLPAPCRQALLRVHSQLPTAPSRKARRLSSEELFKADAPLAIDGYNVILTVEAALKGEPLFLCADGWLRDIQGVGARHRFGPLAREAVDHIYQTLLRLNVETVHWVLDQPVSKSGELAQRLRTWPLPKAWPLPHALPNPLPNPLHITATTAPSADGALKEKSRQQPHLVVASSDAALLDGVSRPFDLALEVISNLPSPPEIVDSLLHRNKTPSVSACESKNSRNS